MNSQREKYAIVSGSVYPSHFEGAYPRRTSLNDPAIQLFVNEINMLKEAPLCVEHNKDDVVGTVDYTFVDAHDPRKGLKIVARIPLNERGEQVVADIKANSPKELPHNKK